MLLRNRPRANSADRCVSRSPLTKARSIARPDASNRCEANRTAPLLNDISHQLFDSPAPLRPADTTTIIGGETVDA
jgi:hypothetical protein